MGGSTPGTSMLGGCETKRSPLACSRSLNSCQGSRFRGFGLRSRPVAGLPQRRRPRTPAPFSFWGVVSKAAGLAGVNRRHRPARERICSSFITPRKLQFREGTHVARKLGCFSGPPTWALGLESSDDENRVECDYVDGISSSSMPMRFNSWDRGGGEPRSKRTNHFGCGAFSERPPHLQAVINPRVGI